MTDEYETLNPTLVQAMKDTPHLAALWFQAGDLLEGVLQYRPSSRANVRDAVAAIRAACDHAAVGDPKRATLELTTAHELLTAIPATRSVEQTIEAVRQVMIAISE